MYLVSLAESAREFVAFANEREARSFWRKWTSGWKLEQGQGVQVSSTPETSSDRAGLFDRFEKRPVPLNTIGDLSGSFR